MHIPDSLNVDSSECSGRYGNLGSNVIRARTHRNSIRRPGSSSMRFCTISLKGIVQRKRPVALPSSGRKRTIWFSRVYASPEQSFTAGTFGVVVKVLGFN